MLSKTVRSFATYTSVAAFILLTIWQQPALAQIAPGVQQSAQQSATISGVVTQSNGTAAQNVDVTLNGPAVLTTKTDANGRFQLINVPHGVYSIVVMSPSLGTATRSNVSVNGDINISVQYGVTNTATLKTIANVTTRSAGAHINVTPASISSVTPTAYAFQGNFSWRGLLNQIPGVTVGGGQGPGNSTNDVIPDSPFQPVQLTINGALPYETSTTLDGMPLSNSSFSTSPGNGVDLSTLPLPLFESADIVRGPGANAPSILDSVGGSFVLHPPAAVQKNSYEASFTNDPYGGYFSNMKAGLRLGKFSATIAYGFNNSPGPLGSGPVFGSMILASTINGNKVQNAGFGGYVPNPIYGSCFCMIKSSLLGSGNYKTTAWNQHNGGLGLFYQIAPSITAQLFYAGNQSTTSQPDFLRTNLFAPGPSYTGAIAPGSYPGRFVSMGTQPILESSGLTEEKITAFVGRGVLRLSGLQNNTNVTQFLIRGQQPVSAQLWGTGAYCGDPACSAAAAIPFTFNGQTATVTFTPFSFNYTGRSTNAVLLASYETQLGYASYVGISAVKTANSATNNFTEALAIGSRILNFAGGVPIITQAINEYRLHAGTQLNSRLLLDASYYITQANYHVQNPADSSGNTWVDSPFSYTAPRVGITWRPNPDTAIRAAAGGGFALPPLFDLVGTNGSPSCGPTSCTTQVTNINLQPEKAFGFDVGVDRRIRFDTSVSADIYKTDLYGQLFQSSTFVGMDPQLNLPTYATEYLNLAHSRYEGVNISAERNVATGMYWKAAFGLTRGYIISVPPGFYNQPGATCNPITGANCQNTNVLIGPNFNGTYQSSVPYANGTAVAGFRWGPKKYVDFQANYLGNNNAYYQPAFVEFDAHAAYPIVKNFALIATFRNITGIHGLNYQLLTVNPNLIAPSVAGAEFPLYPIPYGPRSLTLTADIQL